MGQTAVKPRWAVVLTLLGSLLLLASFATQNFFFNKWDEEEKNFAEWRKAEDIAYQQAALNEILYFVATDDPRTNTSYELVRRTKIHKAATYQALASLESGDPPLDMTSLAQYMEGNATGSTESQQIVDGVHDYASYVPARDQLQRNTKANHRAMLLRTLEFHNRKTTAGYAYLWAYIIGTLLLVIGSYGQDLISSWRAKG
jgi:hypothetical protein